jgi:hypothetical protein
MALPIKETPILRGRDAERFAESARTATSNPVPKEDYERAMKVYKEINSQKEMVC